MGYRDETKITKHIEVVRDDFEWYISTHHVGQETNKTGFSALMSLLLHSYRLVCENPDDYQFKDGIAQKEITKKAGEEARDSRL